MAEGSSESVESSSESSSSFNPEKQLSSLVSTKSEIQDHRKITELVITLVTRLLFRTLFVESFFDQWGHFVDRQMIPLIHHYSFWVPYSEEPSDLIVAEFKDIWIYSMTISDDGWYLFVGTGVGMVIVFDLSIRTSIVNYWSASMDEILCMDSRKSRLVTAGYDGIISVWNTKQLTISTKMCSLVGHTGTVNDLAFNPDGDRLVSCSEDRSLRLWNVDSGHCLSGFHGHSGRIFAVEFPSELFVSVSADKRIKVWHSQEMREQTFTRIESRFKDRRLESVSINCDQSILACAFNGSEQGCVVLFQWPMLDFIRTLGFMACSVSFHPSQPELLALGDSKEKHIRVVDTNTGECLITLEGHCGQMTLDFTPDGQRLVSGSLDSSIRIWDWWDGEKQD